MKHHRFPHEDPSSEHHIGLTVDGLNYPEEEGGAVYAGDGEFPPFVIFDVGAQENLPGRYRTRADAEAALTWLVESS